MFHVHAVVLTNLQVLACIDTRLFPLSDGGVVARMTWHALQGRRIGPFETEGETHGWTSIDLYFLSFLIVKVMATSVLA